MGFIAIGICILFMVWLNVFNAYARGVGFTNRSRDILAVAMYLAFGLIIGGAFSL